MLKTPKKVLRIDRLTDAQLAMMPEWPARLPKGWTGCRSNRT